MRKIILAAAALSLLAGVRAEVVTDNFDLTVKPQNDFYHYANGTWLRNTPVPPEFSRWGTFDDLHQRNLESLRLLCQRASAQDNDSSFVEKLVGDFFASGMDEAAINEVGLQPLSFEFQRISGLRTPEDVLAEMAHLNTIGVSAGFEFGSGADDKDSDREIAQLAQGGLGLPERDYYLRTDEKSKDLRAKYAAHVLRMLEFTGYTPENAQAGAAAVLRIETALAQASLTQVALRDPYNCYHKMSVAAAAAAVPGLNWKLYFDGTGAPAFDEVNVAQPDFFKAFSGALAKTPVEDWQAYLRWHFIHTYAPYLNDDLVNENFNFYGATLTGAKKLLPRWKRVVSTIDNEAGEALGQLYVADFFPPEAKAKVLQMVSDLRASLRGRLLAIDWMDEATRTKALAKLDAFSVKMGYPDKWRDYSSLQIDRGPYVQNVLKANAFEVRRQLRKIGGPVDKGEWDMSPPTVNAYYDPSRNQIVFPAGILQPPFFDPKADAAVNYGGIGAVIGHEMTHGFDDEGRQYDGQGNLADWWTPESAARFKEHAARIVKQFDGYFVFPDLHVNGPLTQGENIADLGGVKIAFAALQKALEGQPREKIDGFTPEQRFFISFASIWAVNIRPQALRLQVNANPHSPGEFRCNGPLSNLPEFAKAFAVPENAPMRRPAAERVEIW